MALSKLRRRAALATLMGALFASPLVTQPAHADRCEPEELVLGPGTSPIDERDHPLCAAMFQYVYPFVCTGSTGQQPPQTLLICLQNLDVDPSYRPSLIPSYSPSTRRIICNLYLFAFPTGFCPTAE